MKQVCHKDKRKRIMKKLMASFVAMSLLVPHFYDVSHPLTVHADSIPQLTAYQNGNGVKLEWAVEMLDSNVLTRTSFEAGEEIPNFQAGGNPQIGNQSVVSGVAYSGNRSIQLTNTMNWTGNNWWWPATSADSSIAALSPKRIPNGTYLSITFKARAVGGTTAQVWFANNSPHSNQGITFNDNNGRMVKFGERVDFNNPPSEFAVYVDGGQVNFEDNHLFTLVTSHGKNHNYGIIFYRWNASKKKFVIDPTNSRPWQGTNLFGEPYTLQNDVFMPGEPVLHLEWVYIGFSGRSVPQTGEWVTFSANAYVDHPRYDFYTNGFGPRIIWKTDGVMNIDDVKFGYATRVQVFKNGSGTPLYDGYLSDYYDAQATDNAKPNPVTNVTASMANGKPVLTWNASTDNGTTYSYTIRAVNHQGVPTALSQPTTVNVTTGIKGYSIVIDSNPNTVPDNTIETTATSYQLPANINSNYYAHIVAVDNAGNVSNPVHILYEDKQAPNLQVVASTTSPTNQNVILTATASDAETGVKRIQKPDGQWASGASATYTVTANGTYTFVAEDNAGNQKQASITVSNIDKIPPTAPTLEADKVVPTNSNVTVTISYPADAVQKQYKIGSGNWNAYVSPIVVSSNTTVSARAIDAAGNVSSEASITINNIDKNPPTVPSIQADKDLVTVVAGTDQESGIDKVLVQINNGSWMEYSDPIQLQDGSYTIRAKSVDKAGNESAVVTQQFLIYKQALQLAESAVIQAETDKLQTSVDQALLLVNALPDSAPEKQELLHRLQNVQEQIFSRVASFVEKAEQTLKKSDYDFALQEVSKLPNGSEKTLLMDRLNHIKPFVDAVLLVEKAEKSRSQDDIDQARLFVNTIPEGEVKESLYERLNAIDMALKLASTKVKYVEKNPSEYQYKQAEEAVMKLVESPQKQELLARLSVIKKQLDDKAYAEQLANVTKKVEQAEKMKRNPYVSDAYKLVSALPDGAEKEALKARLDAVMREIMQENENTNPDILVAIEAIKDPQKKSLLENVLKAVERAEKYRSKANIVYALEKVSEIPASYYNDDDSKQIVMNLVSRANKLKTDFNNGIEEKKENLAVERAIEKVELYEKYKTAYYKKRAQEAVDQLSDEEIKAILQARIDAVAEAE